jgi:hypothetical protein
MVCDNLQEAYLRKRAAIKSGDVSQHLELAQWCLRQRLLTPAADELAEAARTDPQNSMIVVLQHRLKTAQEPQPTANGKPVQPPVSNDDLDRMVRSLPHGSVEAFTQLVQPVLMNNCMAAGCHGSQTDQGLQLFRTALGKASGRRLTQRNLYAVLQYVDREAPAESRLLKAIEGPHGTSRTPIFSDRQATQYQRIVSWVDLVANRAEPAQPASVALPPIQENPTLASPRQRAGLGPRVLPQEAKRASPIHAAAAPTAEADAAPSAGSPKPRTKAAGVARNPSGDPLDPEVFNHLPAGKP